MAFLASTRARAEKQEAVFLSKRGNRLSKSSLAEVIERYAKASGINKHITPHTFRWSCATEMINNHANAYHVKELLGHDSLRSIQAYLDLTIAELKKAHKKHHPRDREAG